MNARAVWSLCALFVCALPVVAQGPIRIGSLDAPRSRAALETSPDYDVLRAALADPALFGPAGVIPRSVEVCPGVNTITASYLADKDVFFTSVFDGQLDAAEEAAIADFVAAGKVLIVDANSDPSEQEAANSMLGAIGTTATLGSSLTCANDSAGGLLGAPNDVTVGPFGNLAGGSFATSVHALAQLDGREQIVVLCGPDPVRGFFPRGALGPGSGPVLYGGDPSAFDLFTGAGGFFNANNLLLYLNTIALAAAECFLVLGVGPGSDVFTTAGHSWTTQVAGIQLSYAVTREDRPRFLVPLPPVTPRSGPWIAHPPTPVLQFSAQVLMWNPGWFPAHPEQSTGGLLVTLWDNGRLTGHSYGAENGMSLELDVVRADDGRRYLSLPFTIHGL